MCSIDLMKYQVHELGKMGETDEIVTSALEDLWPMLAKLAARQAGGLASKWTGWQAGRQQASRQ